MLRLLNVILWSLPFACCVAFSASSRAAEPGRFFEFMDDFTKPAACQRDPFEERIETERHDFTQSATTVGRHIVQIESGYTYFYKKTDQERENSHALPETLLRFGISEDIEFRLRWNYAWKIIDEEKDLIGSEDLRYALKFQLFRQAEREWLPTSALEVRGSAPTGSTFSTGNAELSFSYIYSWELSERISLAGSTGFATNGFGDFGLIPDETFSEYFNVWFQSVALGMEVSDRNTMYAEWFGVFSDGLENDFQVSVLNAGIDHYITDNFVIDVRAGVGLTDDSDDFFTGFGGGFRF